MTLFLQTESEYHSAVKAAVKEAEGYVEKCRKEQAAFVENLKQKLLYFEQTQSDMLEQTLKIESGIMEEEAVGRKEQMRRRQEEKADEISQLLKEEVLSKLWR